MAQIEDIKLKIEQGLSDRQIAKAVGRRRTLIAEIRRGNLEVIPGEKFPRWMEGVSWDLVIKDFQKHPLKFIWEDHAKDIISYQNFSKYFYKKFPYLKNKFVPTKEYVAGEKSEVDWCGNTIEWLDPMSSKINKAYVFVGCLCYSQLLFARAYGSMKQNDFMQGHEDFFNYCGGTTKIIIPDNAKTAVKKTDKFDPEINPEYFNFTKHYDVSVVPARVYKPKDKALVEGCVKIIMRYFKWRNRNHTFTSILEINKALEVIISEVNNKVHTRFKISRRELFFLEEKAELKPLPIEKYNLCETKTCKVHPDGMIALEHHYYSVPYEHIGKEVLVRYNQNVVEIYLNLEKLAVHAKQKGTRGKKSIIENHLPENTKAYRSTTVQYLLQQSKFISIKLNEYLDEHFKKNACAYIRKSQGLLKEARIWKNKLSHEEYKEAIGKSLDYMNRYDQFKVNVFKTQMEINVERILKAKREVINIKRASGNPMLRKNEEIILHQNRK